MNRPLANEGRDLARQVIDFVRNGHSVKRLQYLVDHEVMPARTQGLLDGLSGIAQGFEDNLKVDVEAEQAEAAAELAAAEQAAAEQSDDDKDSPTNE